MGYKMSFVALAVIAFLGIVIVAILTFFFMKGRRTHQGDDQGDIYPMW